MLNFLPVPPTSTINTSNEPPRTLWMGDIDPLFDEVTIINIWNSLNLNVMVKLIRARKNLLIPCSSTRHDSGQVDNNNVDDSEIQKININGVNFIDPNTVQLHHAGYCFIEFESQNDAITALSLNKSVLPNIYSESLLAYTNANGKRTFRLNWASGATLQSSIPTTPEFSLFIGDLSPLTTEADILSIFQKKYKSVKTVRVMTDPINGTSRGFGFIRFSDESERQNALTEMNGVMCHSRYFRVALATPRNNNSSVAKVTNITNNHVNPTITNNVRNNFTNNNENIHPDHYNKNSPSNIISNNNIPVIIYSQQQQQQFTNISENKNTTIFIGGLTSHITEFELKELFAPFGNIVNVKIPLGKNCGFVKYERKIEATAAIRGMQGFIINGNPVRISWGKTSNNNYYNYNNGSNNTGDIMNDTNASNNNLHNYSALHQIQQQQPHQQQQLQQHAKNIYNYNGPDYTFDNSRHLNNNHLQFRSSIDSMEQTADSKFKYSQQIQPSLHFNTQKTQEIPLLQQQILNENSLQQQYSSYLHNKYNKGSKSNHSDIYNPNNQINQVEFNNNLKENLNFMDYTFKS